MEWALFVLIALAAAVYIIAPRRSRDVEPGAGDALRAERAGLLALLRELDDDAASGRISADDRLEGRRALAPRLRAVTESLDALGEPREAPHAAAPEPPAAVNALLGDSSVDDAPAITSAEPGEDSAPAGGREHDTAALADSPTDQRS